MSPLRTISAANLIAAPMGWRFPKISHRTLSEPTERKEKLVERTLSSDDDVYDAMVFSSGGSRGIAHLGAVDMLEKHRPGVVSKCRYFVGSSAGAVVATLLATGLTAGDAMDAIIIPFRYKSDMRLHMLSTLFGIESSKSLETFLETIVPKDITFKDILNENGTVLSIIGSNLNTSNMEVFDAIRTPNMTVYSALRISCAVPLLFTPIRSNGQYYVDGAITNPFPLSVASDLYGCRKILGLRFDTYATNLDTTTSSQPWTLDFFLGAVVDTLIHSSTLHLPARRGVTCDICTVQTPTDVSGVSFDIPAEKKMEIFDSGAESMLAFLKKKN